MLIIKMIKPQTLSCTLMLLICVFVAAAGGYSSRQILDIVFILRVLRLLRVVDSIKRFLLLIFSAAQC